MSRNQVQCIVVGGGPAGSAAALTLAKSATEVVVLERGEVPGSKNMFGGILYTNTLNNIIPGFVQEAPLERHIARQRYSLLTADAELVILDIQSDKFNEEPFNHSFTVSRRKFDEWFADQAVNAGAKYLTQTRVDKIVRDNTGKVIGVEALGDRLYADVVILADGANSKLAEQCGLRQRFIPNRIGLGVKELISMPKGKIQDRFNLDGREGASFKYLGEPAQYSPGGGFILTNEESLSVGLVLRLSDIADNGLTSHDLLERFKNHPRIRRLIAGGNLEEYSAHILPEMGYDYLPEFSADGVLLVGDAAGLMNVVSHEGINRAMASGVMAGLTVVEAVRKNDYSNNTLQEYGNALHKSFVLRDLKKVMNFHKLMEESPQFFDKHLKGFVEFATQLVTISDRLKQEQVSEAWQRLKSSYKWGELFKLWRLV